jgi:hypothetical protein
MMTLWWLLLVLKQSRRICPGDANGYGIAGSGYDLKSNTGTAVGCVTTHQASPVVMTLWCWAVADTESGHIFQSDARTGVLSKAILLPLAAQGYALAPPRLA